MTLRHLLFAVALFPLYAAAEDFFVEEDHLSALPKQADEVVRNAASFTDYRDCRLIGKRVDLSGDGHVSGFIATTADGCAWAAASGPIWIVTFADRAVQLVLSGQGYSVTLGPRESSGLRNVAISAGTAGWYSEQLWRFDGKRYVKVRQKNGPAR